MIKAAGLATGTSPGRAPAAAGRMMRRAGVVRRRRRRRRGRRRLRQAQGRRRGARAGPGERRPRCGRHASAAPARRVADAVREGRRRRPGPRARAARRARRPAGPPRRPPPARRRGARRRRAGRVRAGHPDAPSRAATTARDRGRASPLVADLRQALARRPGARRRDRAVAVPPRRLGHGGRRGRRLLPDLDGRGAGLCADRRPATACRSSPAARAPAWPAARCRRTGRSSSRRRR